MRANKAKYHLKRIETILNLQEGQLSPMDRDILLEDIRHLYETILFANDGPNSEAPSSSQSAEQSSAVSEPTRVAEPNIEPEPLRNQPKPAAEKPIVDSKNENDENSEPTAQNPGIAQPEFDPQEEHPAPPTTVTYEQSPGREEQHLPSTEHAQPNPIHHPAPVSHDKNGTTAQLHEQDEEVLVEAEADYPELFNFSVSADLSDQLGNAKIENLNRILTINDKILFINHLFGGEAIPFQESVRKFEGFYTYDEARSYASRELVQTYNWTHKDKVDTVRQFMRQVKRLYS